MQVFERQFIDGHWRATQGRELVLHNPATEAPAAIIRLGSIADVDAAVAAAQAALPAWSVTSFQERANILASAASILHAQAGVLAESFAAEIGTPISVAKRLQVDTAIRLFQEAPRWVQARSGADLLDRTLVSHVPIGVVACIAPWNYPLYLSACKIVPALLAGATVVLKPSELAPASIVVLADALHRAGLPKGVFNVVFGTGVEAGERLVTHPDIDAVSFTGSTGVGRRIAELAGRELKKVTLELGGKSPSIVLAGADLPRAVNGTLQKCIQNAGQTCAALTRLLVPEADYAMACSIAAAAANAIRVGDPLDAATELGPVISAKQREQALALLQQALDEGASLVAGGPARPAHLPRGYFIAPTVLGVQGRDLVITRTEVFAPILTVQPYRDEEDAIALANGTPFGLSGAVWAADESEALRVARRIRAGSVSINGAATHPDAPFGGFRHSGFGRERGAYGIDEFLTTQAFNR